MYIIVYIGLQETNWKEKLIELESSVAKIRTEEQVERQRMKDEMEKLEVVVMVLVYSYYY